MSGLVKEGSCFREEVRKANENNDRLSSENNVMQALWTEILELKKTTGFLQGVKGRTAEARKGLQKAQ